MYRNPRTYRLNPSKGGGASPRRGAELRRHLFRAGLVRRGYPGGLRARGRAAFPNLGAGTSIQLSASLDCSLPTVILFLSFYFVLCVESQVPGLEFAGTVVAAGPRSGFSEGQASLIFLACKLLQAPLLCQATQAIAIPQRAHVWCLITTRFFLLLFRRCLGSRASARLRQQSCSAPGSCAKAPPAGRTPKPPRSWFRSER